MYECGNFTPFIDVLSLFLYRFMRMAEDSNFDDVPWYYKGGGKELQINM